MPEVAPWTNIYFVCHVSSFCFLISNQQRSFQNAFILRLKNYFSNLHLKSAGLLKKASTLRFWILFQIICGFPGAIAPNVLGIAEGGGNRSGKFRFCTEASQNEFLWVKFKNKKRIKFVFGGIVGQKLNLTLQPRFWQYLVSCSYS